MLWLYRRRQMTKLFHALHAVPDSQDKFLKLAILSFEIERRRMDYNNLMGCGELKSGGVYRKI